MSFKLPSLTLKRIVPRNTGLPSFNYNDLEEIDGIGHRKEARACFVELSNNRIVIRLLISFKLMIHYDNIMLSQLHEPFMHWGSLLLVEEKD